MLTIKKNYIKQYDKKYTKIFKITPKYAKKIHHNMQKYTKICKNTPKYAKIHQNMKKYTKI